MPYDFSDVPDEVLNSALSNTWALPEDARVAASVERARRDAARREGSVPGGAPAAAAPNVEQNLAAAATPIAVEPMAGPSKRDAYAARMEAAGYTPKEAGMAADYEGTMKGAYELPESDETLRRGAAYQRDQDRRMGRFDANLADAMGHNVGPGMSTEIMPNASSRPAWAANAFGGEMINVDGVMVMAYDLGDGKLRYSLGDVKRAKEAAIDAQRSAELSKNAQEDLAAYGTRQLFRESDQIDPKTGYPVVEQMPSTGPAPGMELTPEEEEQQKRLGARRAAEARTRDSHAYRRAQAIRMGEAANMKPSEAMALLRQPGGQAQLAMRGADAAASRRMAARERLRAVTDIAGGSQNLNPVMRAQINALLNARDLESTNPDAARSLRYTLPGGKLAAEVDARQAELAARLAGNAITAALAGQGQGQQAAELRSQQRMENLRTIAGQAAMDAFFDSARREEAEKALIAAGASAVEREMILADLFGVTPAGPAQGTPSGSSAPSLFPGRPPAPPPSNPLAAPRPYG